MLRCDSWLFGSVSSRGRPRESRPPAVTDVTPEPLRDSTGAPEVSSTGVELQPTIRAASSAGTRSFFMVFSVEDY